MLFASVVRVENPFAARSTPGAGPADRKGATLAMSPAGLARPASPLASGRALSSTPELDRAKRALAKHDRSSTSAVRRDRPAHSPDGEFATGTGAEDAFAATPEGALIPAGDDGASSASRPGARALADQLDGVRRAWRDEGTSLRSRLMEMHRTRVAVEQQLAEAHARIARLEAEAREREAGLQRDLRAERDRLGEERTGWDRQAKEWQEELSSFSKQLAELRDRLAEANRGRRDAEAEAVQARTALAAKSDEAASQSSTLAALTERLEAVRQQAEAARNDHAGELEALQKERSEERAELARRLEEARAEAQELEAQLRREAMRAEQVAQDLESQRAQAGTSLASLQARLSEVEADRRRAISEAHRLRELLRVAESEFDLVASAVDELSAGKRSSETSPGRGYGSAGASPVVGGADLASLSAPGAAGGAGRPPSARYMAHQFTTPAALATSGSGSGLGSASRSRHFNA